MVRELFEKNVKFGIYLPPNAKPIFDYFLDVTSGNFIEWNALVLGVDALIRQQQQANNESDRSSSSMIDTVDSIRFTFLTALLLMNRNPVIVTGASGVGKTVIVESMLKKLAATGFSLKSNTILGNVFNYADRSKASVMVNMSVMFSDDNQDSIGFRKNKSDELSKQNKNKITNKNSTRFFVFLI